MFGRPAKIKPENRIEAEGIVEKVKYGGETSMGVGPISRQVPLYVVRVSVQGVVKPLKANVKLTPEVGAAVVNDFKSMGRMFGKGQKPYEVGQTVTVEYDSAKPKKCNILTAPTQAQG